MAVYSPMQLAEAFIRTGELTDALDALNTQLEVSPADDEARRLRAAVLLRVTGESHLEKALSDLETLNHKTDADYVQLSILYERQAALTSAIEAMTAACEQSPQDERLVERLVSLYLSQSNLAAAIHVADGQPRSWRWLQWSADLRVMAGDFCPAVEIYHQALSLLETRLDYRVNRVAGAIRARMLLAAGYACRRCGRLEDAESHYLAALDYYPDDTTIPFNLGLLAALRGQIHEAASQCRAALDETTNPLLKAEMLNTLKSESALAPLAEQLIL